MADLKQLFKTAVASSMDLRGKPAILGKIDGTLYWSSSRRDMIWARVGETSSYQEMVVHCTKVTPQYDMPVRVDLVNGIMSVVAVDEKRYLEFSGNRPGGNVGAHAWLHGRLGPDPLYVTGLQYLPLLVVPSNPAALTVTVEQGAYRWGGTYKIFERATSGSLSSYVPGSSAVKHFVIICLDRVNNTIVIVDGDDVTGGGDALFGTITLTPDEVEAITIDNTYLPLAAILLYNGQTEVRAADIVMDLRTWGGEDFVGAAGIPEPIDDGETYGRMTDTGVSSWVAVVPKTGGTYTGTVTISQGAASDWAVFNTTGTSTTVHMRWKYNSLDRWAFAKYPEATGGAFALIRYDDAGSAVDSPFTVSRSTGKVVIGSGAAIAGTHAIYGGATFAGNMGFYGTAAIAQPSGVKATTALQNLGLGTSLVDYVAETGGTFTGNVTLEAATPIASFNWTSSANYGAFRYTEAGTLKGSLQYIGSTFATAGRREYIEIFNNSSAGGISFHTNNTAAPRMYIPVGGGLVVGTPTGGAKGAGTINAQAIYDDNVLLSDHILDLHYDGSMRPADKERFPGARLWNIEETAVFTEKNRHLPAMPGRAEWESNGGGSLGQLVTALWETVEQQQLQIFELNNRLKVVANG